ncbi:MAG: carbohydrate-binding protein [Chitinophagaceae bacterium]
MVVLLLITHGSKFSGGAAAITDPSNYNTTVTGLAAGTYVFRLTVTQSDNQTATSDVTIIVTPIIVSNGKTIPGKIEAESFDAMNGIQTENTADAGGGMNISWIDNNDWLDYNVNVTTTGTYTVNCRVASPYWGPVFQIRKADGVALATLNVPSTNGWQTWTTVSATVSLTAGPQTLRVVSTNSAGWNFNSMDFVLTSAIAGNAIVNRTILAQPANEVISANTSVGIFPNPVREQFLLKVNNEREGNIQFEIIDQNGRLVKKMQAIKNKGMYQSYISVTGLSQGMYIIKVKMKNWNEAIKMIKL